MGNTSLDQTAGTDAFGSQHKKFQNFVCWEPNRVGHVMDTEALQTPASVFLATHSAMPLYRGDLSESGGEAGALGSYSEESFLRDFLEPANYAFVAVLGGAGTGKSHLIRWLSTRIDENETRRVLLIPRAGTSLHEIVRRILEGVDGERFDEYRKRLSASSMAMSLEEARVRLLDNLAIAVGTPNGRTEGALSDEEDYLATELPHLLRDPVFRPHFLQPGGVIDRLALHVVGGGGVERVEERRAFSSADLPLSFRDIRKASLPAQEIVRALTANAPLKATAVTWLNRHLDEAVAQLMRMSGTDLLRLMLDVRVALKARGVELVILIEDLATLQGIDQQLLEALIIRPQQPGMRELCALRTAVAMTSGYYDGLRKNVRQRFDFRVVMGESDTRGNVAPISVERFTARYLNAGRLASETLEEWYREWQDAPGTQANPVPNACNRCRFRAPCHKAFGAHDGMGLYPFTPTAIANIAARVSPAGFNPRTQLKEGYKPILENYAAALRNGRFPPPALLQRLGHSRLGALAEAELRRRDPTDFARRAVLIDVWSDGDSIGDLDPIVHEAFDLRRLGLGEQTNGDRLPLGKPNDIEPAKVKKEEPLSAGDAKLEKYLREIDAWRAGSAMSQELAQSLREVVYPAVVAHIDWNARHLIPGDFAGAGKGFRQANSIVFARQFLQPGQASIRLPIPIGQEEDPTDAALALQALLRFRHHRSWSFPKAGSYYRAYVRQVDGWAQHVVDQVDRITTESGQTWDPVPAAVQMLSMGARVLGRPKSRDPDRGDLVDALFAEISARDEGDRSNAWQRLASLVRKHQPKTQELVLSRIACSKGNSRSLQIINIAHALPALAEVRRTWRPSEIVPADVAKSLRFLAEYRDGLDQLIEEALRDEQVLQSERFSAIARQIGAEGSPPEEVPAKRAEVVSALRRAVATAVGAGVLTGVQRSSFEEKLVELEGVQLQAWAESVSRIRAAEDSAQLVTELSLVPVNAARVAREVLDLADTMLTRTEAAVRQGMNGIDGDGTRELESVQGEIADGLAKLVLDLSSFTAPAVVP